VLQRKTMSQLHINDTDYTVQVSYDVTTTTRYHI